jgi:hypothetical protein
MLRLQATELGLNCSYPVTGPNHEKSNVSAQRPAASGWTAAALGSARAK